MLLADYGDGREGTMKAAPMERPCPTGSRPAGAGSTSTGTGLAHRPHAPSPARPQGHASSRVRDGPSDVGGTSEHTWDDTREVPRSFQRIGIIGLGYVGLTLAAALAERGLTVYAIDSSGPVLDSLRRGKPHIFEPGIDAVFAERLGRTIHPLDRLPDDGVDAAILCVSTPVTGPDHEPYLENLRSAARQVAESCTPETLVIVRSTVPVGATRGIVLAELLARWPEALLAMAPERTIQGKALTELAALPQVVGGLNAASERAACALFSRLARSIVPVSSLEAAELVKLANNCHTDLIYAYGNELAMLAERWGLDPLEVIRAANLDYPRPDLSLPGYVGGGCLTKDPYILLRAARNAGYDPCLVEHARSLNERLPSHVAGRLLQVLRSERGTAEGATVSVLGWAYKGWPPTDDMRGAPILDMLEPFREAKVTLRGHDVLVSRAMIRAHGAEPVDLAGAFRDADAVLVITNHPEYRHMPLQQFLTLMNRPAVLFDSWRILDETVVTAAGVRYAGIGYA